MTDNSEIPEDVPVVESAPLRENLISTAIKFLQNPKVQSSPLSQKKDFLKRKGLTEEEIEVAVERSGATDSPSPPPVPANQNYTPQQLQSVAPVQQVSTWSKIRDYSALAIIVGGVVYGLYALYKRYIEPMLLRRSEKVEEKLSHMEEGIKEINSGMRKSIKDLQTVIGDLQEQISEQTVKIAHISNNVAIYKAESTNHSIGDSSLSELQAEISSVKGLLLSTKQFPAAPVNPPVIPSWQLKLNPAEGKDDAKPDAAEPSETEPGPSGAAGAQKRIDLEENDSYEDAADTETANDPSPAQHAKMNGHLTNGGPESGIVTPPAVNGMTANLHNTMLVSPTKLATLNANASGGDAPRPAGGESELD